MPVGFTVKRTTRLKNKIDEIVEELHCSKQTDYKKGLDIDDSMYLLIDKDKALELLLYCYDMIEPDQLETKCSVFADIESPFLFSTSQCDKVALIVRRNRQIGMKRKEVIQIHTKMHLMMVIMKVFWLKILETDILYWC